MKKKVLTTMCILGLASGMVACGGANSQTSPVEGTNTQISTEVVQEMITEVTVEEETEVQLPEDRQWVDQLLTDLLEGNREALVEFATSESMEEKIAPYIYESWALWDYEEAYKLVTSDGKILGVIIYEDSEVDIFYSENGDGFESICQGDYLFTYTLADSAYAWFDGNTNYYSSGRTYEIEEGGIVVVWHV